MNPCALTRLATPRTAGWPLLALILAVASARADTNVWDGGSLAGPGWGQAENWAGDSLPAFDSATDVAFYQAGSPGTWTNFLETGRTVRSLTYTASVLTPVFTRLTTTLGGSAAANLTFDTDAPGGDAAITVQSGVSVSNTIGVAGGNIVLADNLLIDHRGTGLLTLSRPITGGYGITKTGAGQAILTGLNTFSGPMSVAAGKLTLGQVNILPDALRVAVSAGATFDVGFGGGYSETIGSLVGPGSVTGKNGGTGSGMTLTVGADDTSDAVFSGVYSGNKSRLAKTGTGKQTLTGANTYDLSSVVTGVDTNYSTLILQGTLQLGNGGLTGSLSSRSCVTNNGTLAFNRSNTVRQGTDFGGLAIAGSGGLLQIGSGALVLTTNNLYSGGTIVSNGTLTLASPAGGATGSGSVTVLSGATLAGGGSVAGAVLAAAGATLQPGGVGTVGTLTLQSTLDLSGSTLLFDIPASGAYDALALSGAGAAGTLTLTGANTLKLNLTDGSLPAGSYTLMTYAARAGDGSLALDITGRNLALNVGDTSVTLTVSGSGAGAVNLSWVGDDSANTWDLGAAALWNNGAGADVFYDMDRVTFNDAGSASPSVNLAATVQPVSVLVTNVSKAYTFAGAGALAGTATLTKQGTNTLTLATANTFSGATLVKGGRLAYGVSDALGSGTLGITNAAVLLGAYTDTVGTVTVEANGQLTGTTGALTSTGSLELKGGTVSAAIAGATAVNATTANSSTLSGANAYAGPTTVGAAGVSNTVLLVNHPLALGSTSSGTTVNGGAVGTYYNIVQLGANIGVTNETLTLDSGAGFRAGLYSSFSGVSVWDGNIVIAGTGGGAYLTASTGGTLIVGGTSDDTITGSSGSLQFRGASTIIVNSRISIGSVNVFRNEAGTTVLNTAGNTWGNTSLSQGTLRLGVAEALPAGTSLSFGKTDSLGNSVLDLNGFSQTVGFLSDTSYVGSSQKIQSAAPATLTVNTSSGSARFGNTNSVIEGAVSLVKAGTGTLTLKGTNTYSGATSVLGGTLVVSGGGTLGLACTNVSVTAGSLTLSNSTAIADSATLRIADGGGAKVTLGPGVAENVGRLLFGDHPKQAGTYGATGSGAAFINDEHFAGPGVLTVLHGNGGTTLSVR